MPTDIREICDLSEEDQNGRIEFLREGLFTLVRRREERPDGLAVFFDDTPQIRAQLDEFVAFERNCCSSIGWSVDHTPEGLRLEISGVDPRSDVFATTGPDNLDALEQTDVRLWPRLLRSVGFGSLGALLVCCILPLGVVALLGATPLLLLDNPWVIGASALGLAGFLWQWETRRQNKRAASDNAGGCGC
jgi:hypothetical protein